MTCVNNHIKGYKLVNCKNVSDNIVAGEGVFGLARDIKLVCAQKVYLRICLRASDLVQVYVGMLDGGKLYEQKKTVGHRKYVTISVVHDCKNEDIGIRIIIDAFGERRAVDITQLLFRPIGDTKVIKRILDKIPYSENTWVNLYVDSEQKQPMIGRHETNGCVKKEIKCSQLEANKQYYIKVLIKEITNCGQTLLDCGVNSQKAYNNELVQRFVYSEGRNPILTIRADKFKYMIDILAIMIAPVDRTTMQEFMECNYYITDGEQE